MKSSDRFFPVPEENGGSPRRCVSLRRQSRWEAALYTNADKLMVVAVQNVETFEFGSPAALPDPM